MDSPCKIRTVGSAKTSSVAGKKKTTLDLPPGPFSKGCGLEPHIKHRYLYIADTVIRSRANMHLPDRLAPDRLLQLAQGGANGFFHNCYAGRRKGR